MSVPTRALTDQRARTLLQACSTHPWRLVFSSDGMEDKTTMKRRMLTLMLTMVMTLSGCWQDHPRTVVVLVDATKSIDLAEYGRCRVELKRLTQRLGRGDRLVLVPITGEPQELLGHRILHVEIPAERLPYDSNVTRAKVEAEKQIEQFLNGLSEIQAKQTDIIGALRATADEFRGEGSEIIILSDMVEDDSVIRFPSAPEMAASKSAEVLAEQMARREMFKGVEVKIGILKSFDLEHMPQQRRDAIEAFWRRYFIASGANKVSITVDLKNLGAGK